LKVGNGFDRDNTLGPLISEKQLEQVTSYIAAGSMAGAEIVTGGSTIQSQGGYFVEPTVFANVEAEMKIVREEIFGPVLCVTPFEDLEEVIQQANDTRYGLGAGIFSQSVDKVHYLASRLRVGNVWVNSYGTVHPALPFGGYKESGWGREMSTEGLDAYLEKKSVFIKLNP
jgi:acyl-CoA reductase-like NAD-dependent aldehyde dehydrogenase